MARSGIEAILHDNGSVGSPAVGLFRPAVQSGSFVEPGTRLGLLQVLGRFLDVRMPPGRRGWVSKLLADNLVVPVAFGEPLIELSEAAVAGIAGAPGEAVAAGEGGGEATEGLEPIRSQTDGVFYRRPNPEEPAFVEVGSRVESGSVLGLVEIMKCFNKVRYDLVRPATVARLSTEDGEEVKSGQVLMYVEFD